MPERALTQPGACAAVPPLLNRPSTSGVVLAFDFGERRIGVAVGERLTRSAHPLEVLDGTPAQRVAAIDRLVAEWSPEQFVVGMPGGAAHGAEHPLAQRIERFIAQLEQRYGLPVARVDESYSSVEAEARLREAHGARRAAQLSRARAIDSVAAQLILEQHLAGLS